MSVIDVCDNLEAHLFVFFCQKSHKKHVPRSALNFNYPLIMVGLVAVVVVNEHVIDACHDLETKINEFLVKNHT